MWKCDNDGFVTDGDDILVRFETQNREVNSNTESSTAHVGRLNEESHVEGKDAFQRETKHFTETTTMHGPKRIFQGKSWAMFFWAIAVVCAMGLLILQVYILTSTYLSQPIISQVTFVLSEDGMEFPLVTFCNLNPVRKAYALQMNSTGDVPPHLLEYLMYYNDDALSLYGGSDPQSLHEGDEELRVYQKLYPNFTADKFYFNSGFDCCQYAKPSLTSLGKCYTLDLLNSDKEWMHEQVEPGIAAGLQVILDARVDEQFDGTDGHAPLFTNSFVDGYRYFVHPANTIPYLASDEITVSPNSVAYSAISSDRFVLLPSNEGGNCSDEWPQGYSTDIPYSASNCAYLCKARYFVENCGCSPAVYNLNRKFTTCTPYETYVCMDAKMRVVHNGSVNIEMPPCKECDKECSSLIYRAYNSYGNGLSMGAMTYLNKKNSSWTTKYMRANFQIINVFFRDMSYTEYNQVADYSITQLLSDIGGNMGMFLGMSVITITEILMYFSKMFWIGLSSKRRDYMYNKKHKEQNREIAIDETITNFKAISSQASLGTSPHIVAPLDPIQLSKSSH
ncbi:unnamed protein product [Caenorhabditis auriculariae]|uniref:Uncharacterized protein n=1 Tax=Caenorhabditis auriculariae TaxID=2777116 RepID=A0A8S1H3S1_9PELO|nr:unnamed protein product [Caenorhabditis auriculariae]